MVSHNQSYQPTCMYAYVTLYIILYYYRSILYNIKFPRSPGVDQTLYVAYVTLQNIIYANYVQNSECSIFLSHLHINHL